MSPGKVDRTGTHTARKAEEVSRRAELTSPEGRSQEIPGMELESWRQDTCSN